MVWNVLNYIKHEMKSKNEMGRRQERMLMEDNIRRISVIIPCYNTEAYIDRCVESVMEQSIKRDSIEVILVNDASSDSTLEKLLAWEKEYPDNILVIDNAENSGPGGAKNVGLQYATSEYVFFLDSDDWIEKDALDALYRCSKDGYFDIVSGKLIFENANQPINMELIHQTENECRKDSIYKAKREDGLYIWNQKDIFIGNVGGLPTATGALYRREILIDNNLYFLEKTDYEDNLWKEVLKLYFSNIYIMDKVIYHYCYNMQSITQKRNNINFKDRLGNELRILEEYKCRGAFEQYREDLKYNFIKRFYLNTIFVIFTNYDYIPDIINYLKNTVVRIFGDYQNSYIYKELKPRELTLMNLLDLKRDVTEEEMLSIRKDYLLELKEE